MNEFFLHPPLCPSCGQPTPILKGSVILNISRYSVETPEGFKVIRGRSFEFLQAVCEVHPEPISIEDLRKRVWGREGTSLATMSSAQACLNGDILPLGLRVQSPKRASRTLSLITRGAWEVFITQD